MQDTANNNVKLAVFDCDGTIVDSQHSIIRSMHAAFFSHNLAVPSRQAIRRIIGLPLVQAFSVLAPNQTPALYDDLRDAYADDWLKVRHDGKRSEPLYPGIEQTLDTLGADGWMLGIATGKSYRGLSATLEMHGLLNRFVTMQTADRARGKPHPEMLFKAMEETGANVANTVMIGDTTFDMEMAINAKVRAIGVAWGYHETRELLATGAEVVLDDFSQLLPALAQKSEIKK